MLSVDIANKFISDFGDKAVLSNLSLNKLVYFAQVESLRSLGRPLFEDKIEAWEYGPVEPSVYHAFKRYGSGRVTKSSGPVPGDEDVDMVVSRTFGKYGRMTAFDLVALSHGDGGAWKATYVPGRDAEITPEAILSSSDGRVTPEFSGTLASGMQEVDRRIPNTFRLLRNA